MRLNRRFRGAAVATAATGLMSVTMAALPSAASEQPGDAVPIDVLGTNDFHGRLEADGQAAGAAVLAGAVDQMRAENPNTVFAAAGDLIGASTFVSFVDQDHPTLDALTAAGLDVSAAGNHEFDQGYCDLVDRVIPFIQKKAAEHSREPWPYLAANVTVADGQASGCDDGESELGESWTTEVDGVTVGFVGAVTEQLPSLVNPDGIEMVDVLDVVDETNRVADDLKNDGADIVVLLVHEGASDTDVESATDPDSEFGAIVNGVNANVDAIVSGHTHLAYDHHIEVPEWADQGREVTERPVVSAGQYGYNLNKIRFSYDPDAESLVGVDSQIVALTVQDDEGNWSPNPEFTPDDEVQDIVDDAVAEADVLGAESLGEITADYNRARQSDGSENRGGESTLGNFVADVQLSAAQVTDAEAQIAFMNSGGLRTDLAYAGTGDDDPDGNVTYREAAEVQPFANTLVTMTLTGEQVVDVLEEQWQLDGASRDFLQLGVSETLTYTYDPEAPDGEHVTSVTVAGEPLDSNGQYRVVANSFLAGGGDDFTTLADGADVADTGQIDLEATVDYLADNSPVSPDYAQRGVGVHWQTDPAAVYQPGDEVALDLSSLLFSAGEPVDESVTVSLGEAELGSFDVDASVVDGTDEVGRASVSVTLPDDLTGLGAPEVTETQLVMALPETGTEFTVPLTVGTGGDGSESGGDDGAATGDDSGTGELPDTGSSGVSWWLIAGIVGLVLGGTLYALSRRGRQDRTDRR